MAMLPRSRHRKEYEFRVPGNYVLRMKIEPFKSPGCETLDYDVSLLDELEEASSSLSLFRSIVTLLFERFRL